MEIKPPYLLFLGDAADMLAAKSAIGIRDWRPERALGQLRLEGCNADLGLEDLTVPEAALQGARTLVVGVANRGGVIGPAWISTLLEALEAGLDIAAGPAPAGRGRAGAACGSGTAGPPDRRCPPPHSAADPGGQRTAALREAPLDRRDRLLLRKDVRDPRH